MGVVYLRVGKSGVGESVSGTYVLTDLLTYRLAVYR
jgi:hypothetical protein